MVFQCNNIRQVTWRMLMHEKPCLIPIIRNHKVNHITRCFTVIYFSPQNQTVLLYLLNVHKTIILKDKCVTFGKLRNIHNTMTLNIY